MADFNQSILTKNQAQTQKLSEEILKKAVIAIGRQYKSMLDEFRIEITKTFEKYADDDGVLTYSEMSSYNKLETIQRLLGDKYRVYNKKIMSIIDKLQEAQLNLAYYGNAFAIDNSLGININWGKIPKNQMEAILNYELEKIASENLNRSGLLRTRRILTQELIKGATINDMANAFKKAIQISYRDAEKIARTETHRVSEQGKQIQFEKAQEQGVEVRKQLLSVLDDRTRPQSARMDGQISNENGEFKYPDGNFYIPGNTGHPEWDINDREVTVEIIDGISEDIRRTREDGIIPVRTFREWAESKGLEKNKYGQVLF